MKTMKMRNVRKCCRLHAKLAENQIGICLVCAGMMALSGCRGGRSCFCLSNGNILCLLGALWFFARDLPDASSARQAMKLTGDFVRSTAAFRKGIVCGKNFDGEPDLAFRLVPAFWTISADRHRACTFESTSFDWRTLTMCSPLILLTLMLLSLCATALYSIGMALTYQRGRGK